MQRRPVFLSVLTHSFLNPGENCRQLLIIYSDVTVVNEQVPLAFAKCSSLKPCHFQPDMLRVNNIYYIQLTIRIKD